MNEHLGIWFTILLVTKNTTDKFDAAHEACGHMHDLATLHMEGAASRQTLHIYAGMRQFAYSYWFYKAREASCESVAVADDFLPLLEQGAVRRAGAGQSARDRRLWHPAAPASCAYCCGLGGI